MRLTKEQRDQIAEILGNKQSVFGTCPFCGHNHLGVHDIVYELREFHGPGLTLGGSIEPLIQLSCTKCGYIHLFNAIAIGILKKEDLEKNHIKKPEENPEEIKKV